MVAALVKELGSRVPDRRLYAAKTLAKIPDPNSVEPLILALRDGESGVRDAAASALGELKDKRALEPLASLLASNDDAVSAAKALGQMADPSSEQPLILALGHRSERQRGLGIG